MLRMWYDIFFINGKVAEFEADYVVSDAQTHTFKRDYQVVAEFERKNIAGYVTSEGDEEDE